MTKAITAWDLRSGRTVYRAPDDQWVEALTDAATFADAAAAQDALKSCEAESTIVVGPYLIEVEEAGRAGGRERLREMIRATGPTVRLDLGKQAGNP